MRVFPDFGGVGAAGELREVVGALLMIVLIVAVLMLIVSAVTWAIASAGGSCQLAVRARAGLLVAVGAACLAGAGVAWLGFLLGIGTRL